MHTYILCVHINDVLCMQLHNYIYIYIYIYVYIFYVFICNYLSIEFQRVSFKTVKDCFEKD